MIRAELASNLACLPFKFSSAPKARQLVTKKEPSKGCSSKLLPLVDRAGNPNSDGISGNRDAHGPVRSPDRGTPIPPSTTKRAVDCTHGFRVCAVDCTSILFAWSKRFFERFRLALATKPYDVPFLCKVPSQNLDNTWNADNLRACDQAKDFWVQATSRKAEGIEGYKISFAHDEDAFPAPKWPTQSLPQLIEVTFAGRMIDNEKHPGLLRLLGARQTAS